MARRSAACADGRFPIYLDGTDTSEQHQGGSWIQTSVDALQEFSVQQNAYSAEQSRSGSFFNATTKSGTNQVRGTLYEFLRNDKLDSRNFFGTQRDLSEAQSVRRVGGRPSRFPKLYNGKNRTFFFVNYEGMRERQGNVVSRTSPTAAHADRRFQRDRRNTHLTIRSTTWRYDRQPFPGQSYPVQPSVAAGRSSSIHT